MTSQTPDLAAVSERLENVEAQNRRLKWGLGVWFWLWYVLSC